MCRTELTDARASNVEQPHWVYLADRHVMLIFNFICLVFSLSIERRVQLRRVTGVENELGIKQ